MQFLEMVVWATAIVKMLSEKTASVGWYVRKPQTIEYILKEQHNPSYLSSVEFDVHKLKLSSDINEVAASMCLCLLFRRRLCMLN